MVMATFITETELTGYFFHAEVELSLRPAYHSINHCMEVMP